VIDHPGANFSIGGSPAIFTRNLDRSLVKSRKLDGEPFDRNPTPPEDSPEVQGMGGPRGGAMLDERLIGTWTITEIRPVRGDRVVKQGTQFTISRPRTKLVVSGLETYHVGPVSAEIDVSGLPFSVPLGARHRFAGESLAGGELRGQFGHLSDPVGENDTDSYTAVKPGDGGEG
jgi:hypothetical protein